MATQLKSDGLNMAESSAPTAAADHGVIYVKSDGHLYFSSVGGSGGNVAETKVNSQSASSVAADDINAGDAAVSLSTSSGDVTVDSNAGAISIDGHTGVTIASSNSGNISIDSVAELHLNSTTGDIKFQDGGTDQLALDLDGTGGEVIMKLMVDSDDFVFQQYDGTEVFRVEDNGAFDIAGGLGSSGVTVSAAGAISADGRIVTDDTTAATSTTDGSLQTDGGLSVALDAVVGDDLIMLSDAAVIHFGANKDVTLTHVADVGLTLTHTGTGDNLPVVLQLKSEEDAVIADEVIASIEFAAGDSDGTDGATVAAGIHAIAEETFAADANATSLVFTAADSETAAASATAKMTLASTGNLTVAGTLTCATSLTIGSAAMVEADLEKLDGITNGTAAAAKAVVLDGSKNIATIGTVGCGAITSTGNSSFAQITASGRVIVDDTTAATSTTDGSLQTDGGLSVVLDAVIGDDLYMLSDGAVIHFGANSDITLTHVADTGLTIQQATETTSEPVLTLKNTGDLAAGPVLDFILDNGAGEGDDDQLGLIRFYGDDSGDTATLYASIKVLAEDVTNTEEDGSITFTTLCAGADKTMIFGNGAGLTLENNSTYGVVKGHSFVTYSDESLKENIQPMGDALDKVKSLQGVTYNWKNDGTNDIGFIAQEVEKVVPEVVRTTGEEGGYAMDYARMTALLVEGMKEQQAQIEELKNVIVKLSNGKTIPAKMGKVKLP